MMVFLKLTSCLASDCASGKHLIKVRLKRKLQTWEITQYKKVGYAILSRTIF